MNADNSVVFHLRLSAFIGGQFWFSVGLTSGARKPDFWPQINTDEHG
jgi:hypothetical protein